jgi:hypothetical protein
MRLAELQRELARAMGKASRRSEEDPRVYMVDGFGRHTEIAEVRFDLQPETITEAEADIRHPVVFLNPEVPQ